MQFAIIGMYDNTNNGISHHDYGVSHCVVESSGGYAQVTDRRFILFNAPNGAVAPPESAYLCTTWQQAVTHALNNYDVIVFPYSYATSVCELIQSTSKLMVMPAGSNDLIRVFNLPIPNTVCIAGACNLTGNNVTGYSVEFTENGVYSLWGANAYSSFSAGVLAGKLLNIMASKQCSASEARQRARLANGDVFNPINGYGTVNVPLAIDYNLYTDTIGYVGNIYWRRIDGNTFDITVNTLGSYDVVRLNVNGVITQSTGNTFRVDMPDGLNSVSAQLILGLTSSNWFVKQIYNNNTRKIIQR